MRKIILPGIIFHIFFMHCVAWFLQFLTQNTSLNKIFSRILDSWNFPKSGGVGGPEKNFPGHGKQNFSKLQWGEGNLLGHYVHVLFYVFTKHMYCITY